MGFTGHRDPDVHLEMLKRYDKYDTILMPLNPADPSYLSFEKMVLPIAVQRGMGIQGMKSTANSKLLHSISLKDCLSLRAQPSNPLTGFGMHDHRAIGRRCPDCSAVQALAARAVGGASHSRREV